MTALTKREHFITGEILERVTELVTPLSHCFQTPLILFDANGKVLRQSNLPSACSRMNPNTGRENVACELFFDQFRSQLKKDIYDTTLTGTCPCGVPVTAFSIKNGERFIGMLGFNMDAADAQTSGMQVLLTALVKQITEKSKDFGDVVSQSLEFQNQLTLSYRFSMIANGEMNIHALFEEALAVIQRQINPGAMHIIIAPQLSKYRDILQSVSKYHSEWKPVPFYATHENEIISEVLRGNSVVINSSDRHPKPMRLSPSIQCILGVPVQNQEAEVLAAIVLVDKVDAEQTFLDNDRRFVSSLANSLGMVLNQIRLVFKLTDAEADSIQKQEAIIARVIHQMRNWYVAIQGNAKGMDDTLATEPAIDHEGLKTELVKIHRNLRAVGKAISDSRKYILSEQSELRSTDISELIAETVENKRSELDLSIKIDCEITEGLPKIRIYEPMFRYMIEELIMNASQHLSDSCQHFSDTPLIRLRADFASDAEVKLARAEDQGTFIVIEVSDNGPGIPDEIKNRIFEPDFTKRPMGTGLGLALVKRDVEQHKGYIVEVGKEGCGADFRILLPVPD
jgi:signal transduction histidine kinase